MHFKVCQPALNVLQHTTRSSYCPKIISLLTLTRACRETFVGYFHSAEVFTVSHLEISVFTSSVQTSAAAAAAAALPAFAFPSVSVSSSENSREQYLLQSHLHIQINMQLLSSGPIVNNELSS